MMRINIAAITPLTFSVGSRIFPIQIKIIALNIPDKNEINNFKFYPNPVNDIFTIQLPKYTINIQIFSLYGCLIYSTDNINQEFSYNMGSQKSGIYLIKSFKTLCLCVLCEKLS